MPLLLFILLVILIAQVGFWNAFAAILGAIGMIILFVIVLASIGVILLAMATRRLGRRW